VTGAGDRARSGDGDIDSLGGEHLRLGPGLEDILALGQGRVQPAAGGAEQLAGGGSVGPVERPDAAACPGQSGGVAGVGQTHLLKSGQVSRGGDGGEALLDEGAHARLIQRRQHVGGVSHLGPSGGLGCGPGDPGSRQQ
jgi:hypothetical protein